MDTLELQYINHYQELVETKFFEKLGAYLGVLWNIKDVEEADKGSSAADQSDEIMIPLSVAINPKVVEYVRSRSGKSGETPFIGGGDFIPKAGQKVVSMANMSKDDFFKTIGVAPPSQKGQAQKKSPGSPDPK